MKRKKTERKGLQDGLQYGLAGRVEPGTWDDRSQGEGMVPDTGLTDGTWETVLQALTFLHGQAGGTYVNPLPEVMLLDLKLPLMDGLEVLQAVRQHPRTCHLPVVILTSSKEERDLVSSYRFGANSYVRKPVSFHDFVDAARELGLYWLVWNETIPDNPS